MAAGSLEGFQEAGVSKPAIEDFFLNVEALERSKDGSVDRVLRIILAISLVVTVCVINISVFCLVNKSIDAEVALIESGKLNPSERIIDGDVFLALIAAVVAEITPVLVLVVKHLFSGMK